MASISTRFRDDRKQAKPLAPDIHLQQPGKSRADAVYTALEAINGLEHTIDSIQIRVEKLEAEHADALSKLERDRAFAVASIELLRARQKSQQAKWNQWNATRKELDLSALPPPTMAVDVNCAAKGDNGVPRTVTLNYASDAGRTVSLDSTGRAVFLGIDVGSQFSLTSLSCAATWTSLPLEVYFSASVTIPES